MKRILLAGITAAAVMGAALPASADNWVLDFDTNPAGGTFAGGQIFSDLYGGTQQYASQIPGASSGVGVNIRAYSGSWHKRYAVGYNSEGSGGADSDLEETFGVKTGPSSSLSAVQPIAGTNNTTPVIGTDYGNVLIIQEKYNNKKQQTHDWDDAHCGSASGGICDTPDDEASGGYLKFTFTEAVTLVGMNIFDIEESGGKVYLQIGTDDDWPWTELSIPTIGNDNVAFMEFGTGLAGVEGVTAMKVKLKGSGAIDNITGDTGDTPPPPGVPEPGAMALFGIGMAGVALARRRRRIAA